MSNSFTDIVICFASSNWHRQDNPLTLNHVSNNLVIPNNHTISKHALHTKEPLLLTENRTIHDNNNQEEDYNTWQLPRLKSEPETLQEALQTQCINKLLQFGNNINKTEEAAKHGMIRYFYWLLPQGKCELRKHNTLIARYNLDIMDWWREMGLVEDKELFYGYCQGGHFDKILLYYDQTYLLEGIISACKGGMTFVIHYLIHGKGALLKMSHDDFLNCTDCALKSSNQECILYVINLYKSQYKHKCKFDTLLVQACYYDNRQIMNYALENGATLFDNALKAAIRGKARNAIDYIMKHAPMNFEYTEHYLAYDKDLELVKHLIAHYSNYMDLGYLCNHACFNGAFKLVSHLLDHVHLSNDEWFEGLKRSCSYRHDAISKMIIQAKFVGNIFYLNAALASVCECGHVSMAKYLLDKGATGYEEALYGACISIKTHKSFEFVEQLLSLYKQQKI
jgi:hypothetical protein